MKLLLTIIAAVVLATTAFAGPIHDAAWDGDLAGVQAELDKGVDVNEPDRSFFNLAPLHYAAGYGFKEIAELLIAEGADVDAKTTTGGTPLFNAAGNNKEIVELLIANGADVNAQVVPGAHQFTVGDTALDFTGSSEIIDLLRKHGGMTGEEMRTGMTPLHAAARKGLKEVVELFIANGADVNVKDRVGETPLDFAINKNRTETADLLREHGGKTGAELNVLLDAAKNGDIEAVKQHLADGADVNAKTADGTTPLHNAAVYGHTEVAELLIANGANMNAIIVSGRNQGKTPLDLAIWRKKNEAADLLRQHGGRTGEELALMPRLMQHGRFAFSFDAKEGKVYEVQDSFDLLNWEVIKTYTGTGASVRFDEERDHDPPKIFYRVKVVE